MSESKQMNGSAARPSTADMIRLNVASFNKMMDAKEADPATSPQYLALMRAVMPPMIRFRVEEIDAPWEACRDAFVGMLAFLMANELFRPDLPIEAQLGVLTHAVSEASASAATSIVRRITAEIEAAKGIPQPTAPGGNA